MKVFLAGATVRSDGGWCRCWWRAGTKSSA